MSAITDAHIEVHSFLLVLLLCFLPLC